MTGSKIVVLTCALFSIFIPQAQNLNCGNCQAWNSNSCCSFFGSCCAVGQRSAVTTTGFCPNPIPNIPPQGISATLCTNDAQCTTGLRCCPIRQASTGQYFQICTVPSVLPVAPTTPPPPTTPTTTRNKPGSCPSRTPDVPPGGITAATICTQDSHCQGDLICCPIRQASTGNVFLICTVPIISTTTVATTTTTTTRPTTTTPPTTTRPTTVAPPTTPRTNGTG